MTIQTSSYSASTTFTGLRVMLVRSSLCRRSTSNNISLGFTQTSSHSGRRTFITNAAKKISSVGGSLRDVQMLAGH
ncbi:MAG: hypothetical protein P8P30_11010, partial [Rickettsiales bacterium]|nr:hypothetical protein [Rickettsiales bacterium]